VTANGRFAGRRPILGGAMRRRLPQCLRARRREYDVAAMMRDAERLWRKAGHIGCTELAAIVREHRRSAEGCTLARPMSSRSASCSRPRKRHGGCRPCCCSTDGCRQLTRRRDLRIISGSTAPRSAPASCSTAANLAVIGTLALRPNRFLVEELAPDRWCLLGRKSRYRSKFKQSEVPNWSICRPPSPRPAKTR
jgi:hypothetical protein